MKSPKKNNGSLYYTFPCIKIFLEDIEKIVDIMRGDSNVVEISDERFNYSSLNDLIQDPKPLKAFYLSASSPYISLNLKALGGATLSASNDGEAKFLKIKDILQKRERWFSFLFSGKLFTISCLFFAVSYFLTYLPKIYNISRPFLLLIGSLYIFAFSLFISLSILYIVSMTNCFISINLKYSYKRESFWAKNRDQILIALFGAIAGVLGTIAFSALANIISSPK